MSGSTPGRPKGRPLPQSHRDNIRTARQWMRHFMPIRDAANAGNRREAIRLLDEYIRSRNGKEAA